MKTCTSCGEMNPVDAQNCSNCGASLEQSSNITTGEVHTDDTPRPNASLAGTSVGFVDAIRICLKEKYCTFKGRAKRSEFWYYWLFTFMVCFPFSFAFFFFNSPTFGNSFDSYFSFSFLALVVVQLAFFLPNLSVSVRRYHDVGLSGWWYLLNMLPFIGAIINLIIMIIPSQKRDNAYGPYLN